MIICFQRVIYLVSKEPDESKISREGNGLWRVARSGDESGSPSWSHIPLTFLSPCFCLWSKRKITKLRSVVLDLWVVTPLRSNNPFIGVV